MRALATVLGIALASVLGMRADAAAATRTITFPLVVDYPILESALRRSIGMVDENGVELWGSVGDCHWAVLDELALTGGGGTIRVTGKGSTVVGFRLLWFCVSPVAWQGEIRFTTRPVVGNDWQLRFQGLAAEARDQSGAPSRVANAALELAKSQLEKRLQEFHFDLAPPAEEAKALVRAAATSERAAPVIAALDSLRPIETVADDVGVRVRVALDVPESETPPAPPEAQLSDAEARAWEDRLDRWDAFLAFVVKTLGVGGDQRVRSELLAILLDGRRELVEVLRQGPVPGEDPVRALFLSSWDRLRTQTRRALHEGTLGERAFRFVTFLAAGDALAALDQAGPGLGLEISADGLRRLARILDPDRPGDPIAVSDRPDPELRSLFGIEVPEETGAAPTSTTTTTVSTIAPTTAPPPTDTTLPLSWLFGTPDADAATADLATIGHRLDRWVPQDAELVEYRSVVESLLDTVAAHRVDRVDRTLAPVLRNLVPAVAWQESCWRQFVRRPDGTVTFLLSATGDIGMMQVNRRVWRGFFDVEKLRWDAVYNAAAGAEILLQLLARFGAKEGAARIDDAARATYSAYNAGPGAYKRYRSPKASALGRAIDTDFYDKYRLVAAGTAGERVLCML